MIIPVGKTFMILPNHSNTFVTASEGASLIIRLIIFLIILACILGELCMTKEMWDEGWLFQIMMVLMITATTLMSIFVWM